MGERENGPVISASSLKSGAIQGPILAEQQPTLRNITVGAVKTEDGIFLPTSVRWRQLEDGPAIGGSAIICTAVRQHAI
jgi:hypothetical protein